MQNMSYARHEYWGKTIRWSQATVDQRASRIVNEPRERAPVRVPLFTMSDMHTIQAANFLVLKSERQHHAPRVTVLNFANASHPGGGYLDGANAPEESIVRLCPQLQLSLHNTPYPGIRFRRNYPCGSEGGVLSTPNMTMMSAGEPGMRPYLDAEMIHVNIVSAPAPTLNNGHYPDFGRMQE